MKKDIPIFKGQHISKPDEILLNQWLIEAQITIELFHVVGRGIASQNSGGGVSGDHRHDQKHDDSDPDQNRNRRK